MTDKIKLFSKFISEKGKNVVIAVGFIGILLIFLSGYFPKKEKIEEENIPTQSPTQTYEENLKKKISDMVCAITGNSNVQVTVTLEKSYEYIYAANEKGSTGESSYIILKDKGGAQKLVSVTEFEPTVKGIVIVCEKGSSAIMKQAITNAVTTAMCVSSTRVCVLELN